MMPDTTALFFDLTIYKRVTGRVKLAPNMYKGEGIQERRSFAELLYESTKKKE